MNAKSPQQKVREYYEAFAEITAESEHAATVVHTIEQTLKMLGIEIDGVNADERAILAYYRSLTEATPDEYTQGTIDGVKDTLNLLGITIDGINA